jgi:hypothetical protein
MHFAKLHSQLQVFAWKDVKGAPAAAYLRATERLAVQIFDHRQPRDARQLE